MRKSLSYLIALGLIAGSFGSVVQAVPRYSMQYNKSCTQCHINPDGHGTRNSFGSQFYSYQELAMTKPEDPTAFNPMINDQVRIGTDSRLLYYGVLNQEGTPGSNSFMQMQGELYLIYHFSSKWLLYLDKGLGGGPSGASSFQIFGMGQILPWNGFVKAGRFAPPYGMYLGDHKAFVRDKLGFSMFWAESGVELGIEPGPLFLSVAATNGSRDFQDSDEGKAATGHAEVRFNLSDLHLWLGASGRYNQVQNQKDRLGGGYGGLSWGRWAVLGEVDYRDKTDGARTKSLVSFAELSYRIYRGITLRAEHDFYDSDLDQKSGSENMYVAGVELVPTGFLQVIPNARFHDISPGSGNDYYEFDVQLHLFY
jgi:hypothetical protein